MDLREPIRIGWRMVDNELPPIIERDKTLPAIRHDGQIMMVTVPSAEFRDEWDEHCRSHYLAWFPLPEICGSY